MTKGATKRVPIGDVHVMPSWEEDHVVDSDCYCCPRLDYQDPGTGRRVWIHNELSNSN